MNKCNWVTKLKVNFILRIWKEIYTTSISHISIKILLLFFLLDSHIPQTVGAFIYKREKTQKVTTLTVQYQQNRYTFTDLLWLLSTVPYMWSEYEPSSTKYWSSHATKDQPLFNYFTGLNVYLISILFRGGEESLSKCTMWRKRYT